MLSSGERPRYIDRRAIAIFLLVLGGTIAIGSYGFFLNDEAALGAAAYSLYHGHLYVDILPAEYWAAFHAPPPQIQVVGGHGYITESRASSVLSFPAYLVLEVWAQILSLDLAFALIACGAIAGSLALIVRTRRARAATGAIAAFMFLAQAAFARPLPDVWVAPAAMQLTSALIFAAGCAAFDAALRELRGPREATWALAVLLAGTTATFWAYGQKYHADEMGALMFVLSFRWRSGATTMDACIAYAVAGLAIWIQPKTGAILCAALLLADIIMLSRRRPSLRATWPQGAAILLAFFLGLSPALVENAVLYHVPAPSGHFVTVSQPVAGGVSYQFPKPIALVVQLLTTQTILSDPGSLPRSLYAEWIGVTLLTPGIEVQLGILAVAPLLVLAVPGFLLVRRELHGADGFLFVHAAGVMAVYGVYAATPGPGSYDSRYLSILFPALAAYAGLAIARWIPAGSGAWIAGGAAAFCSIALAAMAAHHDFTYQFFVLRRVGLLAAALLAGWAVLRAVRDPPRWAGIATVAMGLAATTLFTLQLEIHHPPRTTGDVAHFLPLTRVISAVLARALGA